MNFDRSEKNYIKSHMNILKYLLTKAVMDTTEFQKLM